jgi:hypothetical protein
VAEQPRHQSPVSVPRSLPEQCYNCFEAGYLSRNCPNTQRKPTCQTCKRVGHESPVCPSAPSGRKINSIRPCDNYQLIKVPIPAPRYSLLRSKAVIESNEQMVERAEPENETCGPMVAARVVNDLGAGLESTGQMEVERLTVV